MRTLDDIVTDRLVLEYVEQTYQTLHKNGHLGSFEDLGDSTLHVLFRARRDFRRLGFLYGVLCSGLAYLAGLGVDWLLG